MTDLKLSLQKSQELLNYLIDMIDQGEEFGSEYTPMIEAYMDALSKAPCECDDYNGFNCGCSNRRGWADIGKEEINKLK